MICGMCGKAPFNDGHQHTGYCVVVSGGMSGGKMGEIIWLPYWPPHERTALDAANAWLSKQAARPYGSELQVYLLGARSDLTWINSISATKVWPIEAVRAQALAAYSVNSW